MARGKAAASAYRLALTYQNIGIRSVAGTALTHGLEASARSSVPYVLTQLLQRDGLQVMNFHSGSCQVLVLERRHVTPCPAFPSCA